MGIAHAGQTHTRAHPHTCRCTTRDDRSKCARLRRLAAMGPVAAVVGLGAAAFPVMTFGRGLRVPRGGDERRQAREGQFCVGAVRGNTAAQK